MRPNVKKPRVGPIVVLVVVGGLFVLAIGSGNTDKTTATADATQTDSTGAASAPHNAGKESVQGEGGKISENDPACKADLQCWAEKNNASAGVYCQASIEHLAQYSVRWTEKWYEHRFSRFKWLDKDKGTITYLGDKAEFQNSYGAYQNVIYRCDYDPGTKAALYVHVEAGRL